MLKYNDLKKSPDGMPTLESMIPVMMAIAVKEKSWNNREFIRSVADVVEMPPEIRNKRYASDNGNIIENRLSWAMSRLKTAGFVASVRRGYGEITELGQQMYEKYGYNLTNDIVVNQSKYIEHEQMIKERKKDGEYTAEVTAYEETHDEIMSAVESRHKDEVANELLEKIYSQTPRFFEHLAVELLIAMGYKGLDGFARVTSATKDGGIDGVIKQDPLGIGRVYIQAKRYQRANKVGRPDIDAFYGALRRERADRGVFITSSSFSKEAEEAAKDFSIVTIDGIQLTDLMLQYGVGVKVEKSYHLYKIDEEFLEME